jgi:hypothetical protein
MSRGVTNRVAYASLAALLSAFGLLAVEAAWGNAIVSDEFGHLPAGIAHWEVGRFSIYRENPPLIRALFALPVWLSGPSTDYSNADSLRRSEWAVGQDFLRANPGHYREFFRLSRLVVIALAAAIGVLIFRWVRETSGPMTALVCSCLWFLDPSILAHSTIATTDIGAAAFGLAATYSFWLFLRRPGLGRSLVCGTALGLAQGSKFSLLILYPAFLASAFLVSRRTITSRDESNDTDTARPSWRQMVIIFVTSLLVLNSLYRFEGSFSTLGSFEFQSQLMTGRVTRDWTPERNLNRFRGTLLAMLPIPLPRDYLLGFDSQKWDEEIGLASLVGGRPTIGGRWYSPLETLVGKLPLGTLSILAVCIMMCPRHSSKLSTTSNLNIIAFMLGIILLCSSKGLNWPIRYSIPFLPFCIMGIAQSLRGILGRKSGIIFVIVCLAWNVASLVGIRPCYLSFGNELIGGPAGASRVFVGSNYDWGQDLYRLGDWLEQHPEARPLVVSYYGSMGTTSVGIEPGQLPEGFLDGESSATDSIGSVGAKCFYWAVSSNYLAGLPSQFSIEGGTSTYAVIESPPDRSRAIARAGWSIYIFRVDRSGSIRPPTSGAAEGRTVHLKQVGLSPLSATP